MDKLELYWVDTGSTLSIEQCDTFLAVEENHMDFPADCQHLLDFERKM